MLCFLIQPQKKLQLDHRKNITQNRQKIELYGSLTTKELKKPHSSRKVGRSEGQRCGDVELAGPKPVCGGYEMKGYIESEETQLHTRPPSPRFKCQEYKSP